MSLRLFAAHMQKSYHGGSPLNYNKDIERLLCKHKMVFSKGIPGPVTQPEIYYKITTLVGSGDVLWSHGTSEINVFLKGFTQFLLPDFTVHRRPRQTQLFIGSILYNYL